MLNGTPQQEARWKRGVDFTTGALADDVSQLYVAQYFPPETKAAADELVHNIIAAMDRRIDTLDWMAPETKVKAHAKLAAFTPKIGYPEPLARLLRRCRSSRDDLVRQCDARGRVGASTINLGKLGRPIDRREWGMTPMTINAYANPAWSRSSSRPRSCSRPSSIPMPTRRSIMAASAR